MPGIDAPVESDAPPQIEAAERVRRLLAPEALGDDRFAIDTSAHLSGHLFGGLVAAQSLHAAYSTVELPRRIQSVHMYFLRAGHPELPIEFELHRDTDGRSFSARRVVANQEGQAIFSMICSFHGPEQVPQVLPALPTDVTDPPAPEEAVTVDIDGLVELRRDLVEGDDHPDARVSQSMWVRALGPLPDDVVVHDCLLLYASDLGSPWHLARPEGTNVGPSLDHSVWVHQRTRMDEWHHLRHDPVALADARGLYTGRIWRADGTHVATVAQENLVRLISPS
ncbi:MAG TPA: acyl-CoA thioesterase domain-containing protein [Acidimicrobiales bacterium]